MGDYNNLILEDIDPNDPLAREKEIVHTVLGEVNALESHFIEQNVVKQNVRVKNIKITQKEADYMRLINLDKQIQQFQRQGDSLEENEFYRMAVESAAKILSQFSVDEIIFYENKLGKLCRK